MPRPATGWARWNVTRRVWEARITLADGSRAVVPLPDIPEHDAETAKRVAGLVSKRARETGAVPLGSGETVNEWSERWIAWRKAKGVRSAGENRWQLARGLTLIGTKAMAEVSRGDLERVVALLDTKAREGEITPKTAQNEWGTVRRMFRDASASKELALRVRPDNPAAGIEGPDRGPKKAKVYLYPDELSSLLSCPDVPERWKLYYAFAVYTYMRPGELAALHWEDVHLGRNYIHVHRAVDRVRAPDDIRTTKTSSARKVPIEAELLPLLEALREREPGPGLVLDVPPVSQLSRKLRDHLRAAGIERTELFADDATRKNMTAYDLRATGITWCAIRGDDPMKLMARAGHTTFGTTQGYIREAENLGMAFADVFPALPDVLGGREGLATVALPGRLYPPKTPRNLWAQQDLNL
jgi:integrase